MLIKDVCQTCKLTKKAVECYEKHGLIQPESLENGYRNYSDGDVERLKEISVLRHCGIAMSDILTILNSENKSAELARHRHLASMKMKRAETEQALIDELVQGYDIGRIFEKVASDDRAFSVREKLVMAFPGNYGVYISLHFGRFLDIPIETGDQQIAYQNIVAYLDEVSAAIPDELAEHMQESLGSFSYDGLQKLADATQEAVGALVTDPEAYMCENNAEEYLQYRLSEEFHQSPAGQMAELMKQFQNSSGYRDIFIENMKTLSPPYNSYLSQLEAANSVFLEKFPQARRIYD